MAIVIHNIGKNRYAYEHYRVGPTIKTKYIGPVDGRGNIRDVKIGQGVDRAEIGTTTASLREMYDRIVRRNGEPKVPTVKTKHVEVPEKEAEVATHEIQIIKEDPDYFNQKALGVFESEADADKFLSGIKPHPTKGKSTLVYYIKDGKELSKRKETSPKIPYEVTEAKEKSEKEAKEKSEINKLHKENPEFTKSDIKYVFKKWGEVPERTDTNKKITPAELKEFRLEESYDAVKFGRLGVPESWDSHPAVKKHRDVILDDPDIAIEATILNTQQKTKEGKWRKTDLSREEAKKRSKKEIKIIKDFVEYKKPSNDVKYVFDRKIKHPDPKKIIITNKIVDDKGKEIGEINYDLYKHEKKAYLDWITVNKTHRGKGIADKITNQFIDDMEKQGITEIEMTSIKSKEDYWKNRGWELIPNHPEEGQMRYAVKKNL